MTSGAWFTAEQVRWMLGLRTVGHVHTLAHREGWRRRTVGRLVEYAAEDVDDTRERRLTTP